MDRRLDHPDCHLVPDAVPTVGRERRLFFFIGSVSGRHEQRVWDLLLVCSRVCHQRSAVGR